MDTTNISGKVVVITGASVLGGGGPAEIEPLAHDGGKACPSV
jgi:hypothetical protein